MADYFQCVSCRVLSVAPSLSEQELFSGPLGGLDSGFNSVDSGSKRWSGNEVRTQSESSLTLLIYRRFSTSGSRPKGGSQSCVGSFPD